MIQFQFESGGLKTRKSSSISSGPNAAGSGSKTSESFSCKAKAGKDHKPSSMPRGRLGSISLSVFVQLFCDCRRPTLRKE